MMSTTPTKNLLAVFLLTLLPLLSSAKSCSSNGGACVEYFRGPDCGSTKFGEFVPTCAGNCFQFDSFGAVRLSGTLFQGVRCHAYSDISCQNEIADTGDESLERCAGTGSAKSMKCFFNC
ncbi:hypothetical protein MKEN_00962400 [Mycena kentingensis (nom. inval.)]|nr:hypothetical protein MKEN_00962400 [Mycena kentingensis (nom. inval.)]